MTDRIPALKREDVPAPRRMRKLLRIVIALFIIVLIVLFFRSSLSEISDIQVTGTTAMSKEEVIQALNVSPGDSFFVPSSNQLKNRILSLKPVESAIIVKKFPGVIRVQVKEFASVAVQLAADGKVFIVLSNGLALPMPAGKLPDKPILSGWKPEDPNLVALCRTLNDLPSYLLSDLSEIRPDPSVSYPDRIKLFTRSGFEVVSSVNILKDKIPYLSDIVQNREPGKIIMLEADTYLPYSAQNVIDKTQ
jgi:cell division protein FtsQ